MRLVRYPAAVVLALLVAGSIRPNQEEKAIASIQTPTGAILVWNETGNYFTLEITGKSVRPNNSTGDVFFNVDGMVLQVQVAAFSQIFKGSSGKGQTAESILLAHKDWESEYAEGILGKKIKVQSSPLKLKNGNDALFWTYDMPEGVKAESKKQLFLTMVNNDSVIVLNSVVIGSTKEEDIKQLLTRTLETIKLSPEPFNVEKLREPFKP